MRNLPIAALGGILTVAAYGLCDLAEFRRLWNFRGVGFAAAIIVLAGVIAIGAVEGILLGVLFSLVLVIREVTFPSDALLGLADDGFQDLARRPDARPVPGAVIYRFAGPLFFANGGQFRSRVEAVVEGCPEKPSIFVLDASMVFQVDLVACETLIEVGDCAPRARHPVRHRQPAEQGRSDARPWRGHRAPRRDGGILHNPSRPRRREPGLTTGRPDEPRSSSPTLGEGNLVRRRRPRDGQALAVAVSGGSRP